MHYLDKKLDDARQLAAYFREVAERELRSLKLVGDETVPRSCIIATNCDMEVQKLERKIWAKENSYPLEHIRGEMINVGNFIAHAVCANDDLVIGSQEEMVAYIAAIRPMLISFIEQACKWATVRASGQYDGKEAIKLSEHRNEFLRRFDGLLNHPYPDNTKSKETDEGLSA